MNTISLELIKKLPKVELHCHLDGSLRINSIIDIAKKNKVKLPTKEPNQLSKLISLNKQKISLEDYIALFDITLSVMQDEDALDRISYELMEDLKNDNVYYAEIRFSPILPAKEHKEAFYIIRNNNVNTTVHAGEAFGPQSIHQAIHTCGANRIGHGIRLKEDPELLSYINNHRICLEICLTSNYHTGAVESIKEHPFKYYYEKGIRVSLNTDNRLISNTNLSKEYFLASQLFNLDLKDIREIIIMSMKSSFIPHQKRKQMIKNISN